MSDHMYKRKTLALGAIGEDQVWQIIGLCVCVKFLSRVAVSMLALMVADI